MTYNRILAHRDELKKRNELACKPKVVTRGEQKPAEVVIQGPHLALDLYQIKGHAQDHMEALGITYQLAVPQSMSDSWWFFNCENIPDPMPDCLRFLTRSPQQCVGCGLSQQNADEIEARCKLPLKPVNLDVSLKRNGNG